MQNKAVYVTKTTYKGVVVPQMEENYKHITEEQQQKDKIFVNPVKTKKTTNTTKSTKITRIITYLSIIILNFNRFNFLIKMHIYCLNQKTEPCLRFCCPKRHTTPPKTDTPLAWQDWESYSSYMRAGNKPESLLRHLQTNRLQTSISGKR